MTKRPFEDDAGKIEEILLSRRITGDSPVKCVAIVGGTHGNERHGVHMVMLPGRVDRFNMHIRQLTTVCLHAQVRHYLANQNKVNRESFKTMLLLGNPAAVEQKGE